jgi:hypothetical protein
MSILPVYVITWPANADKPLLSGLLARSADTPTKMDSMIGAEMAKSAQSRTIAGFLTVKRGRVKRRPILPRHRITARPQLLLEQRSGNTFRLPVDRAAAPMIRANHVGDIAQHGNLAFLRQEEGESRFNQFIER